MIKSLKSHKITYMILAFVVALGAALWVTAETENPGKINLTKTATKVYESEESDYNSENLEKGRYAKVTLDVNANSYNYDEHSTDKVDIVLVLDGSGSMKWNANGKSTNKDSERRITLLKNSATSFINTIMDDKGNVKIGLVEYGDDVKNSQSLTDNKETALDFIDDLTANGATNLQSGIAKANEILSNGRSDAKKLVIILTDGVPTYFNYTQTYYERKWVGGMFSGHWEYTQATREVTAGEGDSNDAVNVCYEYNQNGNCVSGQSASVKPSEAAKAELDALKSDYPTADVYTITFGNESEAATILAGVNPVSAENATPIYKNLTALDGDALKEQFDTIAEATQNLIGKNSAVTDVIPADFELTANSKAALEEQGVVVTANEDGTTTLTWTIGNINAGTDYNLSYEVKAKDDYHGSMYTNDNATLTTTVNNDNPYYKDETNKTLTLDFEKPTVEIPAITSDDHYNDNPSYVGYAEATINGTSILTNDKLAHVMVDGTNVEVEDKLVINEDSNTRKVSNNTYEIYKNNVKQGTLTVNEDGTFTFVSEEKVSGEVVFNYHIESTINPNHETNKVISNDSKVTLNILPRSLVNETGKLNVEKKWSDGENQDGIRPGSVSVTLTADGQDKETVTLNSGNSWKHEFTGLYTYKVGQEGTEEGKIVYAVVEKSVPTGYSVKVTGDAAKGFTVTNSHTPELINGNGNLTITKEWLDVGYDKRPESVVLTLLDVIKVNDVEDVKEVGDATLSSDDGWTYTFSDLPKYRNGQEIDYQLVEKEIDENYTFSTDTYTDENGIISLIAVNTIKELKRDIPVTKVWDDKNDQDGLRPNKDNKDNKYITIHLIGRVDGEVKYEDTLTITGNNTDETWDKTLDGEDIAFKDVPTFIEGKLVSYEIKEDEVKGYKIGYAGDTSGYTITNTHTPDTTTVKGYKKWDDNDNQDGKRPTTITINLIADDDSDNPVAHVDLDGNDTTILDEEGNWTFEFNDLPTYRDHGTEIIYTVEEVQTDELKEYYTATPETVTGEDGLVMKTITNSHTPMTISYELTKNWDDFDDQYNNRPDFITVTLTGTVEELNYSFTKTIEVTAADGWKYTFPDLDKYYKGHLIQYTIEETAVPGYNTEPIVQIENVEDEFVYSTEINNTPETVDIPVTKTWDDVDDVEGLRPEKIAVDLYANGEYKETFYITSADDWKTILYKLPKYYDHGKLIEYTLFERPVEGYTTIIDGFNILNRHELGKGTGMDDVEVLPPHTGIIEVSSNNNNILEFILSLIMIIPLTLKLTKIEER